MDRNKVCIQKGGHALGIAVGMAALVILMAGEAGAATIILDDGGG